MASVAYSLITQGNPTSFNIGKITYKSISHFSLCLISERKIVCSLWKLHWHTYVFRLWTTLNGASWCVLTWLVWVWRSTESFTPRVFVSLFILLFLIAMLRWIRQTSVVQWRKSADVCCGEVSEELSVFWWWSGVDGRGKVWEGQCGLWMNKKKSFKNLVPKFWITLSLLSVKICQLYINIFSNFLIIFSQDCWKSFKFFAML